MKKLVFLLLMGLGHTALAQTDPCAGWQDPPFWQRSNATVVRQCLSDSGFVEQQGRNGETPLHRAAEFADFPEAIFGFEGAALDIDALNGRGLSPLHLVAMRAGPLTYVQALVNWGADINLRTPGGETVLTLFLAAQASTRTIKALLGLGADARTETYTGLTPLIIAVLPARAHPGILAALIEAGADPNRKTSRDISAMSAALLSRQPILTIPELLQAGGDPNGTGPLGTPLIDMALKYPRVDYAILRIMVNIGADLDRQDPVSGRSLLHKLAVVPGQESAIRAVIAMGANAKLRDNNGDTPKDLIERVGVNTSVIPDLEATD